MAKITATGRVAVVALVTLLASVGCATRLPDVALVVGNSDYAHAASLANPQADARAVSQLLEKLGWRVALLIDPSKDDLASAAATLEEALDSSKKVLFFYAGHGMQVNGQNYLVPVDFDPYSRVDLDQDLFALQDTLDWMKRPSNQLAVFLDACRVNPFDEHLVGMVHGHRGLALAKTADTRNIGKFEVGRGLAEVAASAGTYIAYATQPGNVAFDGKGRHSPFTEALLDYLDANDKDIGWVMQRVRNDVISETDGQQVPWDHSSLTHRFLVNPKQHVAPPP
jgi:uncharacterized caspase-like protein